MFTIDKAGTITSRPPKKRVTYPFGKMEVGDSFEVPDDIFQRVRQAAYVYGHRNGKKFSVTTSEGKARCWRTA